MKNFNLNQAAEILERTPSVLIDMLEGISDAWAKQNEGPDTWSPYDIVGHLIYGEKTDWIPRMEIILSDHKDKRFEPFDRFAMFHESEGKSLSTLLNEFKTLRQENVRKLRAHFGLFRHYNDVGVHPDFGEVTLGQLLSAWVVHDLNHIGQIARVMANQYKEDVGPWIAFLSILRQ